MRWLSLISAAATGCAAVCDTQSPPPANWIEITEVTIYQGSRHDLASVVLSDKGTEVSLRISLTGSGRHEEPVRETKQVSTPECTYLAVKALLDHMEPRVEGNPANDDDEMPIHREIISSFTIDVNGKELILAPEATRSAAYQELTRLFALCLKQCDSYAEWEKWKGR